MTLLRNLALFVFGFLPAVAIISMILSGVLGDRVDSAPEWHVGWNPVMWLIVTAPWLLPTIVIVPVLHLLAMWIAKRSSRWSARWVLLAASPMLYSLSVLLFWGSENFRLEFVVPVAIAGSGYGALQQIPTKASP